jgi:hypothetical protein
MRWVAVALALLVGCGAGGAETGPRDAGPPDAGAPWPGYPFEMVAATFNTGTTPGLAHDGPPDDGYTSAEAAISDMYYGDGLAWLPAVDAARAWIAGARPDVIGFQEIFHSAGCATVPPEGRMGFVCETWTDGDLTVAQLITGPDYQVACHLEKPDKCLAVRRGFGTFRGCDADLCLDGLDGAEVVGCGGGSRVGRGVIELVAGGTITVVNFHGTSGITTDDMGCRMRQIEQIFVDLDGMPAANGAVNVVLGDFNTDPGRLADGDTSAARLLDFVGEGKAFRFATDVGPRVTPTYAGLFNIDHVITDAFAARCSRAGASDDHPPVIDAVYFDHLPAVCLLGGDPP